MFTCMCKDLFNPIADCQFLVAVAVHCVQHHESSHVACAGLREGEDISPLNALQLKPIIAGAFVGEPGVTELIDKSIDSRAARKEAYMF